MAVLFREHAKNVLEVLLFVAPDPLPLAELCRIVELEQPDVELLLQELQEQYMHQGGLQIIEISGRWQLTTKPSFAPYVERLYKKTASNTLSRAALETLAIIAYRQPVTRAELELIRGVNCDSSVGTLVDKGLVVEQGRRDSPGRPVLYGTTDEFLRCFGLKDLAELPDLNDFMVEAENIEF